VTPIEFASNEAAKIALLAGAVDLIVTDWPWVVRQRKEGAAFSFVPYSKAVGTPMVRPGSEIRTPADLKTKRIGVVGGPLDKSWLILRAYAQKDFGIALADVSEPVFGAPPLLNEELARGRIDAILTYWHYAARLEVEGAKRSPLRSSHKSAILSSQSLRSIRRSGAKASPAPGSGLPTTRPRAGSRVSASPWSSGRSPRMEASRIRYVRLRWRAFGSWLPISMRRPCSPPLQIRRLA
jgi:hypothetical protein